MRDIEATAAPINSKVLPSRSVNGVHIATIANSILKGQIETGFAFLRETGRLMRAFANLHCDGHLHQMIDPWEAHA